MNQDRMKNQGERSRMEREPAERSREKVRGGGSSSERGMGSDIPDRDHDREELEQDDLLEGGRLGDSER